MNFVGTTMLPVCSTTSSCCSHPQISFPGGWRQCSSMWKDFPSRFSVEDNVVLGMPNGNFLHKISFKTPATKSFFSNIIGSTEESLSKDLSNLIYGVSDIRDSTRPVRSSELIYVDSSSLSAGTAGLKDFDGPLSENFDGELTTIEPGTFSTLDISPDNSIALPESLNLDKESFSTKLLTENVPDTIAPIEPETMSTAGISLEKSISLPSSPNLDNEPVLNPNTSLDDVSSRVKESLSSSINKGENTVKNTLEVISSSITSIKKVASEVVDGAIGKVFSSMDQTEEFAGDKFSSFSSNFKEASSKAAVVAIDLLRQTISTVENTLTSGVSLLVYSYGSAKELLPPDIRNTIDLSEEGATEVLRPVGTAFKQVFLTTEVLERNVGLDPNDPIVHFVLFVGASGTFWVVYWLWAYSGYAGDLSAKSAFDLLTSKERSVLVDVRPEALREKDGIPDLRRAARFRYASVTPPEVDGALRKILKGGREVDDILTAAVIKNLKAVQDRSKVIVMDADGAHSKGIARALRKVGIARPYLVQGGFKSWIKEGLRVKELKPETTLTILNEEAEAILEDINPSPLKVIGVGAGSVAAIYALIEWERTLQLIGVVGLGQTIYRRLASYEDAEDFKQDVRRLLAPVRLGGQAFSWAAGKLERNRVGLPTTPSSTDVQSRVLQAAAKHESQPSDSDGLQDPSTEGMGPVNENMEISEA